MKRLSLKTRLVLLHTGMMALVVCIVLALLFSISSREIVSNVENTLEASVFGALGFRFRFNEPGGRGLPFRL